MIPFSSDDVRWAKDMEQVVFECLASRKGHIDRNYTGLHEEGRFYVGYLGELAVCRWLETHRVRFEWNVKPDGRSQGSEFTVWRGGVPLRLEVKTASQWTHKHFMMPEAQELDADIYVGVRLDSLRPRGEVMGWLGASDMKDVPVRDVKVRTRCIPFSEMGAPEFLVALLDEVS